MAERNERGVVLPEGHTGSSLFHKVLAEAVASYGDVLAAARFPQTPGAFKREYGAALARFEAERAASPRREEIARFILRRTQEALMFSSDAGSVPLADHMAQAAPAPALESRTLGAAPGLRAEVPLDGKVYRGREVIELAERLGQERHLTQPVIAALRFIVELIETRGGALDLRGERFAILGAGAELAPTRMLLQAGARVLWSMSPSPKPRSATCPRSPARSCMRPEQATCSKRRARLPPRSRRSRRRDRYTSRCSRMRRAAAASGAWARR